MFTKLSQTKAWIDKYIQNETYYLVAILNTSVAHTAEMGRK
jgi:hypothetical protein